MDREKYKKYNAVIRTLSIGTIIISIVLSIGFLYFTYQRGQKRIRRARRNATLAAKAVCSTIVSDGPVGTYIRTLLENNENGQRVEQGCRDILATNIED